MRPYLERTDFPVVRRSRLRTVQVNLGYRCNQQCVHCHVAAGPNRTENMDAETVDQILALLGRGGVGTLDLTGGAPELNPSFRRLVSGAGERGVQVVERCNLTVLEEPGQEDLAEFLAKQQVEVVASLPCYLEANVDAQRGAGVFEKSIRGLRRLNEHGYGLGRLSLSLVYNPQGPTLPPPQSDLEADYRERLLRDHGVVFDRLFTIANMPVQRFGSMLLSKGLFRDYMELLCSAHREENLERIMCRDMVSVDWRGYLYDCDFNQMLGWAIRDERRDDAPLHVSALAETGMEGRPIRVGGHCYGCTAGRGSSCGGAFDGT